MKYLKNLKNFLLKRGDHADKVKLGRTSEERDFLKRADLSDWLVCGRFRATDKLEFMYGVLHDVPRVKGMVIGTYVVAVCDPCSYLPAIIKPCVFSFIKQRYVVYCDHERVGFVKSYSCASAFELFLKLNQVD